MRILVIGPSWVGDMVMSQSLYRTLKMRYPEAIIDVIAPTWCRPLLSRMPEVNTSILIPINHGILGIRARHKLGRNLRDKHYDRAYVLPNSFKAALIPFFANIPHRTGWRGEMRYGLLNDFRVLDETAWPLMVERYVALAYDKGLVNRAKDLPEPILWARLQVNDIEQSQICLAFGISYERTVIGFCPGAEFSVLKRWPHYHFAELARQVIDAGYQIVLLGSEKEQETGRKIFSMLSKKQQVWCCNLMGKTHLEEAVILISVCKAIVTNDSGLMHIAAALDRPLVALYGPSSPHFTPPLSHKARIIRLIRGYYKMRKSNNFQGYHQSLIDIKPQWVLENLNELLVNT